MLTWREKNNDVGIKLNLNTSLSMCSSVRIPEISQSQESRLHYKGVYLTTLSANSCTCARDSRIELRERARAQAINRESKDDQPQVALACSDCG